jgi:hypothetical protein
VLSVSVWHSPPAAKRGNRASPYLPYSSTLTRVSVSKVRLMNLAFGLLTLSLFFLFYSYNIISFSSFIMLKFIPSVFRIRPCCPSQNRFHLPNLIPHCSDCLISCTSLFTSLQDGYAQCLVLLATMLCRWASSFRRFLES